MGIEKHESSVLSACRWELAWTSRRDALKIAGCSGNQWVLHDKEKRATMIWLEIETSGCRLDTCSLWELKNASAMLPCSLISERAVDPTFRASTFSCLQRVIPVSTVSEPQDQQGWLTLIPLLPLFALIVRLMFLHLRILFKKGSNQARRGSEPHFTPLSDNELFRADSFHVG